MEDNTSGFSLVFLLGFMAFVKESSLRILGWIFFSFVFSVQCEWGQFGKQISPLMYPLSYALFINIFFKSTYPFCLVFLVHFLSNIMKLAYHGIVISIFFFFGYVKICI